MTYSDIDTVVRFADFETRVALYRYANGGPCIRLLDITDQGPVATATAWIPGLKGEEVAIKDYSENTGMLKALLEAGVITKPHRTQGGFPVAYIASEV